MRPRVLVIDDSPIVRQQLARELERDHGLTVIGTAGDPFIARDMIVKLRPDVLTLDLDLPRMNGLAFLRKLMHYHPMPVIIVSAYSPQGSRLALEALEAGAVDVRCKPEAGQDLGDWAIELRETIKAAAATRRIAATQRIAAPALEIRGLAAAPAGLPPTLRRRPLQMIAIGASTGGTRALQEILERLPPTMPGILIVQHMPRLFTRTFAERLNSSCPAEIKEAEDGDEIVPGRVLIAPGDSHMLARLTPTGARVQIKSGPLVSRHRPSVDVLFRSVAACGGAAAGVLLTGMGEDGAEGLQAMHQVGAVTFAQDESSSVVYGMPRAAVKLGAVEHVLPLGMMAPALRHLAGCVDPLAPAGDA